MNENDKIDNITDETAALTDNEDASEETVEAVNTAQLEKDEQASPRKSRAWVRVTAAACLGLLLLCLTGFGTFKMLFGGSQLTKDNLTQGKYLTFNVDTLLDYLAEDYDKGTDTVKGRYAIVSVGGDVAVVHFPQRYLDSADQIAAQTYYQLYGYTTADKYFTASGTVKKASAEITDKYKSWYNSNAVVLYQYGLIDDVADPENVCIVDVDSTGLFNDTVCIILSAVAGVLLVYAAAVLVLIKTGRYDDDITVEIFEDTEEAADEEPTAEETPSSDEEVPAEDVKIDGEADSSPETEEQDTGEQETYDEP